MSKPVALILGAGGNIGSALAKKFSSAGYGIALTARRVTDGKTSEDYLNVKADLSDPASVPAIFDKVKKELGTPSVVVYNAAALTPPPDPEDPFSLAIEDLERDLRVATISAFAAAKEAVSGFDSLPEGTQRAFIYTGNILNTMVMPVPMVVTLGVGKSAAAYWIGTAAAAFAKKGYRFYYADQRTPEGGPVGTVVDAEAHADFYYELASKDPSDVPWHATFVKGKGYTKF
ncbi:hypothetical protein W97_08647 [Coniosporium apollinis CBS 100218]|uniref:Short-chain dehydrogenase n=1 Tax=Coniosporium apollinis (strain CBS 100218) TaxID=1168221 RepID=R7Z5D7_CONA1|nr:uncharacterized protein W97_08647 [Coniosporium apollinis CBS 100218]EON69387.1 hypothetical protein W97_08647 [Coniosporium apollinis CBS 100218]